MPIGRVTHPLAPCPTGCESRVVRLAGAGCCVGQVTPPLATFSPRKAVLGVAAGGLIVLTNSKTIVESLGASGTTVALTAAVIAVVWISLTTWAVRQERVTHELENDVVTEAAAA